MVGRWSASSRQDIGSQRVTRAVCFTSSYTCTHVHAVSHTRVHTTATARRVRAFQSTYRAACEPAKSRAVTTHAPHASQCYLRFERVLYCIRKRVDAREYKLGRASFRFLYFLNLHLVQSMRCCRSRIVGKLSLRIRDLGLPGRGFLCSFCPPRNALGGLR